MGGDAESRTRCLMNPFRYLDTSAEATTGPTSATVRFENRLLRAIQYEVHQGSDLDVYVTSDIVPSQSGATNWVLNWWRDHQYKTMASMAWAVLAIPCGSVSVERLFNGGKNMIGLSQYSLRDETFRILMLLNSRSHIC